MERIHQTVRYSLLVICILWRESTCTQHYVLLGTELQHCGQETTQAAVQSSIAATPKTGSVKPSEAPKEVAAVYKLGGEYVELAVFIIPPKYDKITVS